MKHGFCENCGAYGGRFLPTRPDVHQKYDRRVEALSGLRSLKVLLATDSPEVRGWAPAVQQAAQRAVNAAINALNTDAEKEPGA